MTKHLQKISLILTIMLVFASASMAQVTTSSLQGLVKGSDGEALIGATVIATHEPSGTTYGSTTNLDGRFNLTNMRVGGPYIVDITYVGYQPSRYSGIVLKLGESFPLTATLNSGTELAEIVITGTAADGFTSTRTGAATNINQEQLQSLPQLNRSVLEFTRLTPQASGNSFAGRDARYNNLQIDGANFNNGFGLSSNPLPGGQAQPISLDAIQEITVNIAPFDVLQSGFTGAGINAVTRSGTNSFSGSAYRFIKNQNLQGTKIGDNEIEKVDAKTENFGFRLGGPIIKNKLFFFVNAEREELRGANASGTNLWRPSTDGVADAENNIARTTVADLEAVASHLRNQWNYEPGRYEGYADEAFNYNTKFLTRIDWNISQKHKLSVRYNQVVGISNQNANGTSGPRPRSPGFASRVSQNSITFENGNYGFENSVRSVTAELNSFFSNKVSNQFLATYSRIQDTRTTPGSLFPFVDIWDGGRGNGDQNYMSFGTELFSFNNEVINKNASFINNLTYNTGKHTVTGGVAFEIQNFGNSFTRSGASLYRYASVEDFLTTGTANEVAPIQFALTYPYEGQETYARVNFGLLSIYAQDKINVDSKLQLTIGVRAELPTYRDDLTANPSIDALNLLDVDGNERNYNSSQWPTSRLMVSPRIGFNYDVKEDRSFIIRGGMGIFSGRVPFVWLTNMPTGAGVLQNTVEPGSYAESAPWIGNITFNPDQYAYLKNPPVGGESVFIKSPNAGAPNSFALVDNDFRMPMVSRTSLGVDYSLPNTPITLTADFLYTRDINAVVQLGANRTAAPSQMNAAGDTRDLWLPGQSTAYNPALGGNNAVILTNSEVKGHSLSATLGAAVPNYKGFSASLYYTYSAAKDVSSNPGSSASSAWGGSANINSPNDQVLNISEYAIPNRLVGSLNYRVEYGNKFATTIGVYFTGENQGRFSYTTGNDLNGDGINSDLLFIPRNTADLKFVQINASGNNPAITVAEQVAAFDKFVADNDLEEYRGQYAPRNAFLQPWLNRFDIRLLQDFYTNVGGKRHTIQFSVDVVNFGNMLNSDWGIQSNLNGAQNLLSRSGAVRTNPNFTMNRVSGALPNTPFQNASGFGTTWGMQFGLRYIF